MITYWLTYITVISKLYIIYHQDRRHFDNGNIYLLKFSENFYNERYNHITVDHDVKYYVAKLVLGKIGDKIFKNYSTYNHCIHLYNKDEDYGKYGDKLPMTYKWLFTRYIRDTH